MQPTTSMGLPPNTNWSSGFWRELVSSAPQVRTPQQPGTGSSQVAPYLQRIEAAARNGQGFELASLPGFTPNLSSPKRRGA